MRTLMVTACLLAAGCSQAGPIEPSASEVAQLDARLAGYAQSGPPVSCVNMRDLRDNHSFGQGVIVFDGPTKASLYVNRPPAGCDEIGMGRALIIRTTMTRLCRGDIGEIFDITANISHGSCALGDFTPYRRVKG